MCATSTVVSEGARQTWPGFKEGVRVYACLLCVGWLVRVYRMIKMAHGMLLTRRCSKWRCFWRARLGPSEQDVIGE